MQLTRHAQAVLLPGRGDDVALHVRALDAVVEGRLVRLVQRPDRHEQRSHAKRHSRQEVVFEIRLLQLELLGGVLVIQLRLHAKVLREFVFPSQDEPVDVDHVPRAGRHGVDLGIVVVELAVAVELELPQQIFILFGACQGGLRDREEQRQRERARERIPGLQGRSLVVDRVDSK